MPAELADANEGVELMPFGTGVAGGCRAAGVAAPGDGDLVSSAAASGSQGEGSEGRVSTSLPGNGERCRHRAWVRHQRSYARACQPFSTLGTDCASGRLSLCALRNLCRPAKGHGGQAERVCAASTACLLLAVNAEQVGLGLWLEGGVGLPLVVQLPAWEQGGLAHALLAASPAPDAACAPGAGPFRHRRPGGRTARILL